MLWKKVTSFARLIKNDYEDQLWLFAIILVMLLLAIAGLSHWDSADNANVAIDKPLSPAVQMINTRNREISLAQVQAIVSKPMADLMAMQVYDESRVQNSYELVAQTSVNQSELINKSPIHRVRQGFIVKHESAAIYLSQTDSLVVERLN